MFLYFSMVFPWFFNGFHPILLCFKRLKPLFLPRSRHRTGAHAIDQIPKDHQHHGLRHAVADGAKETEEENQRLLVEDW